MARIVMKNPIVEIDGDEMTRVLWGMIKENLILPYVDLKSVYYDLGLKSREATDDKITEEAALAIKKYRVGVKCATITPNEDRMTEYNLSRQYPSPNGTLRAILDGTVFRTPIVSSVIRPKVSGWKAPITVARHAYGDLYKATEIEVPSAGEAVLCFRGSDGTLIEKSVFSFPSEGVLQAQFNRNDSILSFARSCFSYALSVKQNLMFSVKDTISKSYDARFRQIFASVYQNEYKKLFEEAGITYFYTLIDDAVARVMRSEGGFVWALKNYDGDVMSDMVSSAFGSLAMMTSVLVSPDGCFEYEAAHGTVTRHYYRYLKGEKTGTNPVATIFAWSGALRKRGEIDGTDSLVRFADALDRATLATIEEGIITGDLKSLITLSSFRCVDSLVFIREIAKRISL